MLRFSVVGLCLLFLVHCSDVDKAAQRRDCSRGWTRFERTKSCYYIHDVKLKWADAERNCQLHGGHLASVVDEYESIFIYDFAKKANLSVPTVWLGKILKLTKNGAYEWHDNTMGRYGAGFRGEPPTANNICVTIWADYEKPEGSWNEWDCNYFGFSSVCKKGFRRPSNGNSSQPVTTNDKTLSSTLASTGNGEPTPPQHASKRCCATCPQKCAAHERCIPDDLNCLIKSCNSTAGWCLPTPIR